MLALLSFQSPALLSSCPLLLFAGLPPFTYMYCAFASSFIRSALPSLLAAQHRRTAKYYSYSLKVSKLVSVHTCSPFFFAHMTWWWWWWWCRPAKYSFSLYKINSAALALVERISINNIDLDHKESSLSLSAIVPPQCTATTDSIRDQGMQFKY